GKELLGCSIMSAKLKDPDRDTFVLAAQAGEPVFPELPVLHDSLSGRAFYENRTVVENAYASSPAALALVRDQGVQAAAAVPLCDAGHAIGVILAGDVTPGRSFDTDDVRVLETVGALAEIALGSADRAVELVRRSARIEAMQSVIQELAESYDLQAIVERALDTAISLFGADRGAVWLNENDFQALRPLAVRGLSREYVQAVCDNFLRTGISPILRTHRPVFIRDVRDTRITAMREPAEREGFHTLLLIPTVFRGRTTGALSIYHDIPWSYNEEDLSMATSLGQQLGLAVANAQLHNETKHQLGRISALSEIGRAAVETVDLNARCERCARALLRQGDLDSALLYLLSADGPATQGVGQVPPMEGTSDRIELTEDTVAVRAVVGGRVVLTDEPDLPQSARERLLASGLEQGVAVPMVHRGKVVGALLAGRRDKPFVAGGVGVVRGAANPIAATVEHARVFAQLSETSARLAAILRCAPEGVIMYGINLRVVYYNARAQQIYGLEGRDLTGWTPDDFFRELVGGFPDPQVPEEIRRRVREESLSVHRLEFELAHPQRRIVERISAPVLGEAGQHMGQVILLRDITTQRDAEGTQREHNESGPGRGR